MLVPESILHRYSIAAKRVRKRSLGILCRHGTLDIIIESTARRSITNLALLERLYVGLGTIAGNSMDFAAFIDKCRNFSVVNNSMQKNSY